MNYMDTSEYPKKGAWVRIQSRGVYYGDLGIIHGVYGVDSGHVAVTFVPRIQTTTRPPGSKARPPRALFNESSIKDFYGARAIRQHDNLYEFQNNTYNAEGFLVRTMKVEHITTKTPYPTLHELKFFEKSILPLIHDAYTAEMKKHRLRMYDRVRVKSGSLQDRTGYIVDFDGLDFVSIQADGDRDIFDIPADDVEKYFSLGDAVHIVEGNYAGTRGFIVSMDNGIAEVFDHSRVSASKVIVPEFENKYPFQEVRLIFIELHL